MACSPWPDQNSLCSVDCVASRPCCRSEGGWKNRPEFSLELKHQDTVEEGGRVVAVTAGDNRFWALAVARDDVHGLAIEDWTGIECCLNDCLLDMGSLGPRPRTDDDPAKKPLLSPVRTQASGSCSGYYLRFLCGREASHWDVYRGSNEDDGKEPGRLGHEGGSSNPVLRMIVERLSN